MEFSDNVNYVVLSNNADKKFTSEKFEHIFHSPL